MGSILPMTCLNVSSEDYSLRGSGSGGHHLLGHDSLPAVAAGLNKRSQEDDQSECLTNSRNLISVSASFTVVRVFYRELGINSLPRNFIPVCFVVVSTMTPQKIEKPHISE